MEDWYIQGLVDTKEYTACAWCGVEAPKKDGYCSKECAKKDQAANRG